MTGNDSSSVESEHEGVDEWFDRAWVESEDVEDLFGGGADRSVEVAKSSDRLGQVEVATSKRSRTSSPSGQVEPTVQSKCPRICLVAEPTVQSKLPVRKKSQPAIGTLLVPAVPSLIPHRDNLQRRCQAMWSSWSSQKREIVKSVRILKLLS